MVNVRSHSGRDDPAADPDHWAVQLPRLLQPQGVRARVARSGQEAVRLTRSFHFHAALIDMATPRDEDDTRSTPDTPGGLWLLDMLARDPRRRLPVVVVNSRAVTQTQVQRYLNEALRRGAFSVINHRPAGLEPLLNIIARLVDRLYDGQWPADEIEALARHQQQSRRPRTDTDRGGPRLPS